MEHSVDHCAQIQPVPIAKPQKSQKKSFKRELRRLLRGPKISDTERLELQRQRLRSILKPAHFSKIDKI